MKQNMTHYQFYIPRYNQAGFSLVEIMIASLIGIFIMGGGIAIHVSNKQAFLHQEATSYTQKNARLIISRLNQKINAAGYSGFFPGFTSNPVNDHLDSSSGNSILWDIKKPVYGYDNLDGSSLFGITDIINGSDVLMLKTMKNISGIISQTSNSITLNRPSVCNDADILIATDANKATVFQIANVDFSVANQTTVTLFSGSSPAPGNTAMPSLSTFATGNTTEVGKLETSMYMLKPGSNGRNALFEATLVTSTDTAPSIANAIEIIPNVDDMQIVYGIDTNADNLVDKYTSAASVTSNSEWDQVRSIGVALVISSDNRNITPEINSYSFDPQTFSFTQSHSTGDKRYRKSFISYVKLKNI